MILVSVYSVWKRRYQNWSEKYAAWV